MSYVMLGGDGQGGGLIYSIYGPHGSPTGHLRLTYGLHVTYAILGGGGGRTGMVRSWLAKGSTSGSSKPALAKAPASGSSKPALAKGSASGSSKPALAVAGGGGKTWNAAATLTASVDALEPSAPLTPGWMISKEGGDCSNVTLGTKATLLPWVISYKL